MLKNNNTYDLIISMGGACNCTKALRHLGLQNFSYPFDWLYGSTLTKRIEILKNRFYKFFDFEDIEQVNFIEEDRIIVKNLYTKLFHNHDFFVNKGTLQEQYSSVKAKYDRRINRILNLLDKFENKSILLVYFQRPTIEPDDFENYSENDLKLMIKELEKSFPNSKFNILFVKSSDNKKPNKIKYIKSNNKDIMMAITYNRYRENENKEYAKYELNLIKILKHYKIKYKYSDNLKKRIKTLYLVLNLFFN